MSNTDFLEVSITEQDDDTQQFNLVKRLLSSYQFNNSVWVPKLQVPAVLIGLPMPIVPTTFVYIRNTGTFNIGVQVGPMPAPPVVPPNPPTQIVSLTLIGPGGIMLLVSPDLAGAFMSSPGSFVFPPGGPFPLNISGGFNSIFLQASSVDPAGLGEVEYFLAG